MTAAQDEYLLCSQVQGSGGWQIRTSNWFVGACDLVWPKVPRRKSAGNFWERCFFPLLFYSVPHCIMGTCLK